MYSLESTKTLQTESTWSCATADAKKLAVKIATSMILQFITAKAS